jgi:hypothetical protein
MQPRDFRGADFRRGAEPWGVEARAGESVDGFRLTAIMLLA